MLNTEILLKAWRLMATAKAMAETYDANRQVCKYVHSTSRGHEAIQIATGLQLKNIDWVSPYYRDDSIMLSMGFSPYELMLQLLAKRDDPFSGGRSYYCHPSNKDGKRPGIIHQSSATGMQAIPTTGLAQGIDYLEKHHQALLQKGENGALPVVVCSFGDNSITEGEVSEAFQFAVLKQLPIIYLVQDNQWGISVSMEEARAMTAYEYAAGFKGLARAQCDGSDFISSFQTMTDAFDYVRRERKPILVHATVPLLGHHTSGVRKEFYRSKEDLDKHALNDPYPKLKTVLLKAGLSEDELNKTEISAATEVAEAFAKAQGAPDPDPVSVTDHVFAPTPVKEEKGNRSPKGGEKTIMVDAALHAVEEIMQEYPEAIL
jgi:2-oxoisovalerate dehydrogenase E1 component